MRRRLRRRPGHRHRHPATPSRLGLGPTAAAETSSAALASQSASLVLSASFTRVSVHGLLSAARDDNKQRNGRNSLASVYRSETPWDKEARRSVNRRETPLDASDLWGGLRWLYKLLLIRKGSACASEAVWNVVAVLCRALHLRRI